MKYRLNSILLRIKQFIETKLALKKDFTFVAIGDSTVEGVGASKSEKSFVHLIFEVLRQKNKRVKFYNLGKRGATISDLVESQLNQVLDLSPNLVLISVGVNDLRKRTRIENFERDLGFLIETVVNKTDSKVIVNSIPDLSNLPALSFLIRLFARSQVKKFNKVISRQAEKHGAIFIDLHSGSNVFTKKYPELISSDGLHPSDIGYAVWAAAVISQAKEGLKEFN